MSEFCRVSLKPLRTKSVSGANSAQLKSFVDGSKASLDLPFSRKDFFENGRKYVEGISISGVQQKLSLIIKEDAFKPTDVGGRYILKPSPEAFPNAAENEHTAMKISNVLGFRTADCALAKFTDGEYAYICKRFDRELNEKNIVIQHHQEDLLQCMNLVSESKYILSYEEAGRTLLEVTRNNLLVASDYVNRIIFAYLIGNDDLHLKNFSVIRFESSKTHYYDKLAPNYDCLFCEEYTGGQGYLALDLLANGEDDSLLINYQYYGYYTGYDFIVFAERLGVVSKIVEAFIKLIGKKIPMIESLIKNSFMPDTMKDNSTELIKNRFRALQILTEHAS
ncbi:type II toxin-antitoxin system HipA family toxin [Pelagibaculum spongiae]|uniref:HipA-like C-terminal domain-containing protein n=1 Tax=Pelagibaculum spongiae TaxID=2080658 RepID=A0A2V1GXY2_9GAMM|nr:HipA domain-containing protein [Pelagibaculum spongiae]PVZ70503.1 hypothetical protein DC094_07940 [Pelagibaculum spongiae]